MSRLTHRRAVLIAPGSDERKARKALESNADEVVLDLEDAVTAANKARARELVMGLLTDAEREGSVSVRVNGLSTPWASDDLAACAGLSSLASIVLPKTETAQDVLDVARVVEGASVGVQALVESPVGIHNIEEIAGASSRLEAVIIGYADLGASLGRSPSARPEHWLAVQDRVLIAARAAGVMAIDGPFFGTADNDAFRQSCEWTSALGFDGKWVIHPAQIATATSVFTPSDSAIEEAKRVLDALAEAEAKGSGAAQVDGRMVDEAVALAARRVLARVGGP